MILVQATFDQEKKLLTKTKLIFSVKDPLPRHEVEQLKMGAGYLAFNPDEYRAKVIGIIKNKRIGVNETDLTFSERLRKVLFLISEEQGIDFNDFYAEQMERIIQHYKNKYL